MNETSMTSDAKDLNIKISYLALFIAGVLFSLSNEVRAEGEHNFNPAFLLGGAGTAIDLSRFSQANVAIPGRYSVEVRLNDEWKGKQDVEFAEIVGIRSAQPCFDKAFIEELGVDLERIKNSKDAALPFPAGRICGDLEKYIPQSTVEFDVSEQVLKFTVPQKYINRSVRGYVPPSKWDRGVNAGTLGYNFNSYTTQANGQSLTSNFLGLSAGLNLGDWRLRYNGSGSSSEGKTAFSTASAYAQRDITTLKSQLVLGDSYTGGQLFDSYRLRGARLFSDDRMLPESQVGYAPVVRGVARTNAKVTIKQRDYVVYETTVPPGPFELDDLNSTGYSGDLQVTVTESDGSVNTYIVPFTAIPQLLRPGHQRFSFSAGMLDETNLDSLAVAQLTYERGLNNTFTGYGGLNLAKDYHAAMAGVGMATPVGGFALDITGSRAQLPGALGDEQGMVSRLSYNKNIVPTGTNVTLAAYRYSTAGYLSLIEAAQAMDASRDGKYQIPGERSRFDVTVAQTLTPGWGNVYASGSVMKGRDSTVSYTAGYNNYNKYLSWGVSLQHTRDVIRDRSDTSIGLNVSVPLGQSAGSPRLSADYNWNKDDQQKRLGINGFGGDHNQFSYNASAGDSQRDGTSLGLNGGYKSSVADLNASYSHSSSTRQMSLGASGGIVAHPEGLTFTSQLGDTVGVVSAPGAEDAGLLNNNAVHLDSKGYAVVPYLTPYRLNQVEIDPKGISADVELQETTRKVAPTAGAVVMLKYTTVQGKGLIIDGSFRDGSSLPFGANVIDAEGNVVGVVGQGGRAFVRIKDEMDTEGLIVRWGGSSPEECRISYPAGSENKTLSGMSHFTGICNGTDGSGITAGITNDSDATN